MAINNLNNGNNGSAIWDQINKPYFKGPGINAVNAATELKRIDELENADKLVLHIPKTETIYKRKELVNDATMGKDCATCYTYVQKTLTFDDGKGGEFQWKSPGTADCIWMMNPTGDRTFSKSTVNMSDISHAVEETWEVRERSLEKTSFTVAEIQEMSKNGQSFKSIFGYSEQTTSYKYASAAITEGTVKYKNGAEAAYRETAVSSREIYNKCISYIGAAFGDDTSDMKLTETQYNELFGKTSGNEKSFSVNAAKKRDNLNKQLERVRDYMNGKLNAIHKNDPNSIFLQSFRNTYENLQAVKASDIAALVLLTSQNPAIPKK